MKSIIGKTIKSISAITHYSMGSLPESAPLLIMTDDTHYFYNGYTWEQIKPRVDVNTHVPM